jgi:hypothetical protein
VYNPPVFEVKNDIPFRTGSTLARRLGAEHVQRNIDAGPICLLRNLRDSYVSILRRQFITPEAHAAVDCGIARQCAVIPRYQMKDAMLNAMNARVNFVVSTNKELGRKSRT